MAAPGVDGRQFGPYRLVHQIATGGMAEIYLAKTRGIGGFEKYVALKMIHPNFSSDEHFIRMLIDEAKITVQLQHVNIAQTFDLGRVEDIYYIAMEYIDGADLYRVLRRASEKDLALPIEVATHITREVATGLDYAHKKRDADQRSMGIIHRDISPQNVLISAAGEVKIVDFGIAKASMRARQTAAGVIKGKYYYMSPEQAWGDPLDARTDIFSTGILLYEMLTGQMLYLEEDLQKLLDIVRKAEIPPPSKLRKDVPPELDRIVMRALTKKRELRWQTAAELGGALERFLHGYAPQFHPSRVTTFLAQVLDEKKKAPAPVPSPVGAGRVTKDFGRESIMSRGEFTDENSVIFRLDKLDEKVKRRVDMATNAALEPEPDDKTVVTGGPQFAADVTTDEITGDRSIDKLPDDEPTRLERAPVSPDATQELEDDDVSDVPVEEGFAFPTMPYRQGMVPPALAGTTPSPASSVNRAPLRYAPPPAEPDGSPRLARRQSRRTPLGGIHPIITPTPTPIVAPLPPPDVWPADRPVSSSGSMRARLDTEDVSHLKLGRDRKRLAIYAGGAVLLVAGVATIVVLARGGSHALPTGSIEIVSVPPGAELSVEGKPVGPTPATVHDVPAGKKLHFAITLARYETWQEDDVAIDGKLKVIAALKPIVGHLVVTSTPDGAGVFLDSAPVGLTPLDRGGMDPFVDGTIELRKQGYETKRLDLKWDGRREVKLDATLVRTD